MRHFLSAVTIAIGLAGCSSSGSDTSSPGAAGMAGMAGTAGSAGAAGMAGSAGSGCTMCSGACTDTNTDVMNCGSCGNTCTVLNGTPACSAGKCEFSCDSGYQLVGSDCELIGAPRPVAPLSTSRVTTRSPTLRWELAPNTTGAKLEICLDPSCNMIVVSYDHVAGESFVVPSDLPSGVIYWRLFGNAGNTPNDPTGTQASPVWQLYVPEKSAPTDTSWGTTLDLNLDGYADFAVLGGNDSASADIYLGASAGPAFLKNFGVLTGPTMKPVASPAGDVDGDGHPDLVIGDLVNLQATLYVFSGADLLSCVNCKPLATISVPDGMGVVPEVSSLGDVDGDGYADIAVGTAGGKNVAFVYRGGPQGLAGCGANCTPLATLASPSLTPDSFGRAVAGAGDVDGDGYPDLLLGAYADSGYRGKAYLYRGGPNGLASCGTSCAPNLTLLSPPTQASQPFFGLTLAGAGDVNGDGRADVVVAAPNDARVYLFDLSQCSAQSCAPAATLTGPPQVYTFGTRVASAGDVDKDGLADILVASAAETYVFKAANLTGCLNSQCTLATEIVTDTAHGAAVAGLGDVNGDGVSELMVGKPNAGSGVTYLADIAACSGLSCTAGTTLTFSVASEKRFGSAIVGAR